MLNKASYRQERPAGDEQLAILGPLAVIMQCRRGQEIYGQEEPAKNAYRIMDGAAQRFAMPANGRRRIVDFLLPGDFFGFATRDRHSFTVEAVSGTTVVARYERRRLDQLEDYDPRIAQAIRAAAAQEISRLQARVLLLGRITALAKVGGFLLEMTNRSSRRAAEEIVLPMSRYDIADYLALSVETVSRAMTLLKLRGAIALTGTRQVRILNPDLLDETDDSSNGAMAQGGGFGLGPSRRRSAGPSRNGVPPDDLLVRQLSR